jgi:hypothetical protein
MCLLKNPVIANIFVLYIFISSLFSTKKRYENKSAKDKEENYKIDEFNVN